MRRKLSESRTYQEAHDIGEQRILDGIAVYDKYALKERGGVKKYFVQRNCPFCGAKAYKEEEKFQNRWGVARCMRCHSLYVNPCPTQEVLDDYYNNYKCNTMLEDIYAKRAEKKENAILDTRVETILAFAKKMPGEEIAILDVGCSNGSFLARIKSRAEQIGIHKRLSLFGVDVNENAIIRKVDPTLNLICSSVESFLEETQLRFDIVWHSELVEHLIDPYFVFTRLNKVIREGGAMIFTTPNDYSLEMENLSYNIPRPLACNILPPMHLNAFSTLNVPIIALRSGFCVESIQTPGNFDVELLEMDIEEVKSDFLNRIKQLGEEDKEFIQNVIVASHGSSHLQCVLTKPIKEKDV